MSVEEVQNLASGLSIKNIGDDTVDRSVLQAFTGTLANIKTEPPGENDQYKKDRVVLEFVDIADVESTEPYPWPTFPVRLNAPAAGKKISPMSALGVLMNSSIKYLKEGEDFGDLKGRRLQLRRTSGHKIKIGDGAGSRVEKDMTYWEVEGVVGSGTAKQSGTLSRQRAIELLDGKTLPDYNVIVLSDQTVLGDPTLVAQIASRVFVSSLLADGTVTVDGAGVYHVAKAG